MLKQYLERDPLLTEFNFETEGHLYISIYFCSKKEKKNLFKNFSDVQNLLKEIKDYRYYFCLYSLRLHLEFVILVACLINQFRLKI